ncbi:hypothetical protein NE865_13288 [Phthorimaea operculella]|nr:hypothetical protein NE865_13288 [Phthorimaea operculella]
MAKVSVGTLSVFNHEVQEWSLFKERLKQWFLANDLSDLDDKASVKRRAILLSSLAENTYRLVRDLALPKDVGTISYDDVIKLLDAHFKVTKCGFAERHKFYTSTQLPSEGFAEWAARVRGLATHCGFPTANLEDILRDRFVLGMIHGPERDRLFTMKMEDLDISKAIETAEGIRCARMGAAESGQGSSNTSASVLRMDAVSASRGGSAAAARSPAGGAAGAAQRQQRQPSSCPACGYLHENPCRFAKYRCDLCNVRGHLRRVCPRRKVRQNFIECCSDKDICEDGKHLICNIRSVHGEPMQESVLVSKHSSSFDVDSGSEVTIIPVQIYNSYFADMHLFQTK